MGDLNSTKQCAQRDVHRNTNMVSTSHLHENCGKDGKLFTDSKASRHGLDDHGYISQLSNTDRDYLYLANEAIIRTSHRETVVNDLQCITLELLSLYYVPSSQFNDISCSRLGEQRIIKPFNEVKYEFNDRCSIHEALGIVEKNDKDEIYKQAIRRSTQVARMAAALLQAEYDSYGLNL